VRAVVTGGAGFIGSHVVDALVARGDEVTVIDDLSTGQRENINPAASLVEHDIREPFEIEADTVFHLAAQADVVTSVERPTFDAEVNVIGLLRVLEAAGDAQVVFTSTGGAIYGECERPAREDDPRQPLSPYGTSKLAGEEYLATWNRLHGARHVALRLANVYGPRQQPTLEGGVIAIFLNRMGAGDETLVYGDGLQSRDFVHVADVARALLAAVGAKPGVYNIGTGVDTNILDLHALCRRATGTEGAPTFADPRPGEILRSVLDPSAAERELGWRAEVDLEEGLRKTWEESKGQAPK
jgi:UDP-glucose 4-epimerase